MGYVLAAVLMLVLGVLLLAFAGLYVVHARETARLAAQLQGCLKGWAASQRMAEDCRGRVVGARAIIETCNKALSVAGDRIESLKQDVRDLEEAAVSWKHVAENRGENFDKLLAAYGIAWASLDAKVARTLGKKLEPTTPS